MSSPEMTTSVLTEALPAIDIRTSREYAIGNVYVASGKNDGYYINVFKDTLYHPQEPSSLGPYRFVVVFTDQGPTYGIMTNSP